MSRAKLKARTAESVLVALAALAILLATASQAVADHGDGSGSTINPDNTDQEYEFISMTSGGQYACSWGEDELNRSQINTSLGDGDIHCLDGFFGGNFYGQTTCTDVNWWNDRCNHYDVQFELSINDPTPDTGGEFTSWAYIGCHEFGHTGGLGHEGSSGSYSSCMENGSGHTMFRQHDLNEINEDV